MRIRTRPTSKTDRWPPKSRSPTRSGGSTKLLLSREPASRLAAKVARRTTRSLYRPLRGLRSCALRGGPVAHRSQTSTSTQVLPLSSRPGYLETLNRTGENPRRGGTRAATHPCRPSNAGDRHREHRHGAQIGAGRPVLRGHRAAQAPTSPPTPMPPSVTQPRIRPARDWPYCAPRRRCTTRPASVARTSLASVLRSAAGFTEGEQPTRGASRSGVPPHDRRTAFACGPSDRSQRLRPCTDPTCFSGKLIPV
jgi:hypothetical protein